MRAFSVGLLLVGGLVASSFADVSPPSCATNCLETYLPQSGCNATDAACICSDVTLTGQVQNCTLAACTTLEALTALNATKTFCGEPVRDLTVITPVVTAISGTFAIVAAIMRLVDSLARDTFLNWSNFCIVMSLLTWLSEILYMVALGLTKIAMLLLYLKVFPGQTFQRICFVMVAICLAYIPAAALATAFNCTPVSYNWTGWTGQTEGHCFSFNTFAWAQSSINIVLDLTIILLPIPQLWRLNMGRKKRIQLVLMFSVGLFITIVSIVRLTALVNFATTTNATYDNVPTAYWSVLEIFVSIICCCLPAVRSLLKRAFPSCFGSSGGSKNTPAPYMTPKSPRYKLSGGIQKSITNTITFGPSSADGRSDIELVDERWRDRD
ncbi:hypothetical protein INS49_010257 [Diaporthe citri]|uniref:uncharacterized protein n=1 Tax=Diaporthe citri TaxID=83186 RepID=UPI001C7EADA7|nr:uncharacterized protein INS49_010257 [Diaporthe citri]KAG6362028.1 hypothetical protein INS49_010257 [Diaporthe citri]